MSALGTKAIFCAALSFLTLAAALPALADNEDSPAAREARWQDIEQTIFADKKAVPDASAISLDAPYRAEDAALVPMTVSLHAKQPVTELYLVIDDNPSPVAAHYVFGPAADPDVIQMRVRVNSYTNVHVVAKLQDGSLVEATKFVKAAGGCSAPMGMSDEEAMKGMGEIRMKFSRDAAIGKPTQATLMVRHPMFNGMQMNQVTRLYTPARYISSIDVRSGSKLVFTLSTGISLATNPVLVFKLAPQVDDAVTVSVKDNKDGQWQKTFSVPVATN